MGGKVSVKFSEDLKTKDLCQYIKDNKKTYFVATGSNAVGNTYDQIKCSDSNMISYGTTSSSTSTIGEFTKNRTIYKNK